MVLEERIQALEEALATRERNIAQMRDSMLQADLEYKKVGDGLMGNVECM